jgi:hypothetical protein
MKNCIMFIFSGSWDTNHGSVYRNGTCCCWCWSSIKSWLDLSMSWSRREYLFVLDLLLEPTSAWKKTGFNEGVHQVCGMQDNIYFGKGRNGIKGRKIQDENLRTLLTFRTLFVSKLFEDIGVKTQVCQLYMNPLLSLTAVFWWLWKYF